MAQPLYQLLAQRHPKLELDVFAPAWTLPLFKRMPEVTRAIANPFAHGELRLTERYRLARELREADYEQAIVLPNSLKSALIPWLARIPLRTGFLGEQRYGLLNDWRKLDELALPKMVDRFSALAQPRNDSRPVVSPEPRLTVNPATARDVAAELGLSLERPVAALCPGAEYGPAKRWPARHFAALAKLLIQDGYAVWVMGSSKESELGAEIAGLAGSGVENLCGRTSLDQAIDLLALAHVAVTNDSGLMHVAAALQRPLVAVYGSSSATFTPPLSKRATIVSLNVECSPCFKRECPLGHMKCLNDLTPLSVMAAVKQSLSIRIPLE